MAKIDDITFGNWQVFRKNLTDAVMPYYTRISAAFSDPSRGVGKVVVQQRKRVSEMLGLLARMEGRGLTPITRKELKRLDKLNIEFRKIHGQVVEWVKDSIPLRKGSESAIENLAISPKDAKNALKISKPSRSRMGGSGLAGMLGMRRLGAMGLGAGAGGLLGPMLGPLAGPSTVAAGGLYGAYRLAKGLGGIAGRRRGMPGGVAPSAAPVMTGAPGQGIVEGLGGTTHPRDAQGRFTSRKGIGLDLIEQGLFKFFNKRALRAKWTRRLLRATEKGITKKDGRGVIGGVLGSFKKLGALLPGVLLALGPVAGLAAAAVFTGIQLKRAGGAALELWEVHKAVSEHTQKMLKKQMGFLEKTTAVLAGKMQARQKAGDEPGRKGAFQELLGVEKEKVVLGEKLKREKRGFFGQLAHDWKTGAKGISSDVQKVTGIKKFGDGGVVTKPTLGILGEDNIPELVTPLGAGNVVDILKAIMKNTAKEVQTLTSAPIDTFMPPFDLADPLLNRINMTGSLS